MSGAWLMLFPAQDRGVRFIRAEGPCWKGELSIAVCGWALTLGWQRER